MATRVNRSASSGGKRAGAAGAKMRPSSLASADGPAGSEVDSVRNPTELFRRINAGDWEGALTALNNNPAEAATWISRRAQDGEGKVWTYLPLHLICLQRRPPIDLLEALMQHHPETASMPTPHDGNLPMHYACEGGCEDESVFQALLAGYPPSLEAKNAKGKTPLLVCHAKSRGVLMKVLRQRKPLPFGEGKKPAKREKKKSKKGAERRDDIDASWPRTKSHEERQPPVPRSRPKTTPARYAKHRPGSFADGSGEGSWDDALTPRVSNGRDKKTATEKETVPFFTATSASASGSADYDTDTGSFISSKTTELARTALNFLYPSYQDGPQQPQPKADNGELVERVQSLTKENADQKRMIEELTEKLAQATSSNEEASAENSQLCERILAKAEADSVAFRTKIQKLRGEKERMRQMAEAKEEKYRKHLGQMTTLLLERGCAVKTDASNDDIFEGTKAAMEALEGRLSRSEVALKKTEAKRALLQGERDTLITSHGELERKVALLEEEKTVAQKGWEDLKDLETTLTVINENLKEQLEGAPKTSGEGQAEKDAGQKEQKQVAVLEAEVASLLEQNRSLKDKILRNNETHSAKVTELGEKYAALEKKANKELRQGRAETARGGERSKSDLRVHLQGDSKLLYEV